MVQTAVIKYVETLLEATYVPAILATYWQVIIESVMVSNVRYTVEPTL